jgi:preprotein translocase subunit SecG
MTPPIIITALLALLFVAGTLAMAYMWRQNRKELDEFLANVPSTTVEVGGDGSSIPSLTDSAHFKEAPSAEPFLTFECGVCQRLIVVDCALEPGQLAVTDCLQCNTRWAAYLPPVDIRAVATTASPLEAEETLSSMTGTALDMVGQPL